MANIASTAGMSPGLIYRYFENKNAIILAIIEQQLKVARQRIRELQSSENLAKRLVDFYAEQRPDDDNALSMPLYLEISAQGTRDPQIAKALRHYDVTVCAELGDWLRRSSEQRGYDLPPEAVSARALTLLCLIEGLKLRGARNPPLDRRMLREILEGLLDTLIVGNHRC